jgi:hypothetical protein
MPLPVGVSVAMQYEMFYAGARFVTSSHRLPDL